MDLKNSHLNFYHHLSGLCISVIWWQFYCDPLSFLLLIPFQPFRRRGGIWILPLGIHILLQELLGKLKPLTLDGPLEILLPLTLSRRKLIASSLTGLPFLVLLTSGHCGYYQWIVKALDCVYSPYMPRKFLFQLTSLSNGTRSENQAILLLTLTHRTAIEPLYQIIEYKSSFYLFLCSRLRSFYLSLFCPNIRLVMVPLAFGGN